MTNNFMSITAIAPVNIAVVKYWGKRDEKLILPINGSISGTLDLEEMRAKTSIISGPTIKEDRIWLNQVEQSIENERLQNVLREIRKRACKWKTISKLDTYSIADPTSRVHICSENNFPTAAGLASSAAGLACLVFALSKIYGVEEDVTDIARLGSGSACRSLHGGFVEWVIGEEENGEDSRAHQVCSEDHWPEMRVIILVVNAEKKHTSSTGGMETSVKTSQLLKYRADYLVVNRLNRMRHAIINKDFETFAKETMQDSNQMHAACLDTYPPIIYLSKTSQDIISLVHSINDYYNKIKVAYTFDAGPNACLYLLEQNIPEVLALVMHFFPSEFNDIGEKKFLTGKPYEPALSLDENLLKHIKIQPKTGAISYVINTKIGSGPKLLPFEESLFDLQTALPLKEYSK